MTINGSKEWAISLTDLRNRTRLGTGPCQGSRCASRAIAVLASELDLSGREIQEQTLSFLERRWRGKRPILSGVMVDQEELNQAAHFVSGNLSHLARVKGSGTVSTAGKGAGWQQKGKR